MKKSNVHILIIFLVLVSVYFKICTASNSVDNQVVVTDEIRKLEQDYSDLLKPIQQLKTSDPNIYWFIVSWLNTNYRTPIWTDYAPTSEWRLQTKKRGIDCSGFARVMQSELFDRNIKGGSQGILDTYCKWTKRSNLEMGDLVFFKAPGSKSKRAVHTGVYLFDDYFVHATSPKSAAKGLGLNINSLKEPFWEKDFITGAKVIEKK